MLLTFSANNVMKLALSVMDLLQANVLLVRMVTISIRNTILAHFHVSKDSFKIQIQRQVAKCVRQAVCLALLHSFNIARLAL